MSFINLQDEEWRAIVFDGIKEAARYEISNYGRVRRWNPKVDQWDLKRNYIGNGYYYQSFVASKSYKRSTITKSIHRLVAEAFLEKQSEYHNYVIHVDHDLLNNHVDNLRWLTQRELTLHNQSNPKVIEARKNKKRKVTNSKLTETQVIRLKKRLKYSNNPLYKIAREFGITHTQLNRIRKGENWGHVQIPDDEDNPESMD